MNISIILSYLNEFQSKKLQETISLFESSLADKHIWNSDFKDGKSFLANICRTAVDNLQSKLRGERDETYQHPTWDEKDPRWYTIYTPDFSNMGSAAAKLMKYESDPMVSSILPIFLEVGEISQLVKEVKPFIEKGRKPNPNAVAPDLTNTATCAICFNIQKLTKDRMVSHGYHISDGMGHYFGFRNGSCFGVGYPPYEESNEANVAYKEALENTLVRLEARLDDLESGKVSEISRMEKEYGKWGKTSLVSKTYTTTDESWKNVLAVEKRDVNATISAVKDEIDLQISRIKEWNWVSRSK